VIVNISSIFVWTDTIAFMKKLDAAEKVVFICDGKKCGRYSKEIRKVFKDDIKEFGLKREMKTVFMSCTDNCKHAPVVSLQPHNVWIGEVDGNDVPGILKKYYL
jgi:(2Fe-2S) ferredoxin